MASPSLQGRTAAILIASDRSFAGTQVDRSGPALRDLLGTAQARVLDVIVSPDDIPVLVGHLRSLVAARVNLIITSGGTGLGPRDNTPEATLAVCDRLVPGLAELLRREGVQQTPFAALSRGVCGIAGGALVINLPGNPAGAVTSLQSLLPLLPHALDLLGGKTRHDPPDESTPAPKG